MAVIKHLRNTPEQFGWGHILLHWGMALAVLALFPIGLYIDTLTYYDPGYRVWPHWHKSIGILLMLAFVLRFIAVIVMHKPAPLEAGRAAHLMAKAVHGFMYLLLLVVMVSGYLISTADGRGIDVFNWFTVPALPSLHEHQEDIAGEVHFISAVTLISFTGLHALAALKRHFVNKDHTLKRMMGIQKENA